MRLVVARFLARLIVIGAILASIGVEVVAAFTLPDRAVIAGVRGKPQRWNLSCEARSAVDWAAFWGVDITERQFLKRLPRSKNPDEGFVGNPGDAWGNIPPLSYGVHAEPVASLLRDYGLQAEARRQMDWDELRSEIAAGRPVIVWVIGQMWKGAPIKYKTPDGHKTTVARFEHTMVVFGYDHKKVYLVDAYTGDQQSYPIRTFLASWQTLGRMAIVGGEATPTSTPTESEGQSQSGAATTLKVYLPGVYKPAQN